MFSVSTLFKSFACSLVGVCCCACSSEFNITGASSLRALDGEMVYLRTVKTDKVGKTSTRLDSCRVKHGRFSFVGNADSVVLAELRTRNERLMPILIEDGTSHVEIDKNGQYVVGSALNDRLNKFLTQYNLLENEYWELDKRKQSMLYEGLSQQEVFQLTEPLRLKISDRMDNLEADFVLHNANNTLGLGYFLHMIEMHEENTLSASMKRVLNNVPLTFFDHPEVQRFCKRTNFQRSLVSR